MYGTIPITATLPSNTVRFAGAVGITSAAALSSSMPALTRAAMGRPNGARLKRRPTAVYSTWRQRPSAACQRVSRSSAS
jgi:hypothetical protein